MKTVCVYTASWVVMAAIGVLNGIVREYLYGPFMSELNAHRISTLIVLVLFGIFMWWLSGTRRPESAWQALAIGSIWLVMTVVFEFVFGHFIVGYPWHTLLHDFNLAEGRVWPLVLAWITLAPLYFYFIRVSREEAMENDEGLH